MDIREEGRKVKGQKGIVMLVVTLRSSRVDRHRCGVRGREELEIVQGHCLRYRKEERMGVRPSAISSAVPPLPSKNEIWRAG